MRAYQAKTFRTEVFAGSPPVMTSVFTGVILCPSQFPAQTVPTLALGFTPATDPPHPDKAISLAGGLVHEMAHVYGHSVSAVCK